MLILTAPPALTVSRAAVEADLRHRQEERQRRAAATRDHERAAAAEASRHAVGTVGCLLPATVFLGAVLGLLVVAATAVVQWILPEFVSAGMLGVGVMAVVWWVAFFVVRLFALDAKHQVVAWNEVLIMGSSVLVAGLTLTWLDDRYDHIAAGPKIAGGIIAAAVMVVPTLQKWWRGRRRLAAPASPLPPVHDLPVHIEDVALRRSAFLVATARVVAEHAIAQRLPHLEAFEHTVAGMEDHLAARRFSAFWTAVEAATRSLAELEHGEAALAAALGLCGGQTLAEATEPVLAAVRTYGLGESLATYEIRLDDGTVLTERAYQMGPLFDQRQVPQPWTAPAGTMFQPAAVAADDGALTRFNTAYQRYADALVRADSDFEMASIGQQFRMRAALDAGFDRLEQAIAVQGARMCGHIMAMGSRLSADLSGAVHDASQTAAHTVAGSVTQAAAGTQAALQRCTDAVQASSRRIQSVYVLNA